MSNWIAECSTCQYYNGKESIASNCLRHPPQIVVVSSEPSIMGKGKVTHIYNSKFPAVEPDDWCGDYKPHKIKFRNHMEKVL